MCLGVLDAKAWIMHGMACIKNVQRQKGDNPLTSSASLMGYRTHKESQSVFDREIEVYTIGRNGYDIRSKPFTNFFLSASSGVARLL